jgi:hypothetical protein
MIYLVKIPRSLICPMSFMTTSRNCYGRLFNRVFSRYTDEIHYFELTGGQYREIQPAKPGL